MVVLLGATLSVALWPPSAPTGAAAPASQAGVDAFYRLPTPLPDAPPGTVIRRQSLPVDPSLPRGTKAWRVLFHSTGASGGDLVESGMIVIPAGPPPPGGFPIASWAHGTTGLAPSCAPSRTGGRLIPGLRSLLDHRMIVTATDYRGLGVPGVHPYLVGAAEGEDVLDAARAARSLADGTASDAVVVFGFSQGGQAALFAGELAPTYAPDLFLAGVAAVSPVTSALDLAAVGSQPPPSGQSAFSASLLWSWAHLYRGVRLASALTPAGLADLSVVRTGCIDQVAAVYDPSPPDRFFRPGWQDSAGVVAAEHANLPGTTSTAAPILVIQGLSDEVIPPDHTRRFVANRLCRADYDSVDYVALSGAGHTQALTDNESFIVAWLAGRFAGKATTDSCAIPSPVSGH